MEHRSSDVERTIFKGIPVTPKLRTVIDLARVEDDETVKRALRAAKFSGAELAQLPQSILALGAVPTRSPVEDSAEWHDDPLAQLADREAPGRARGARRARAYFLGRAV